MKRYVYYQPNEKDIKDKYSDCQIRALARALDCTWLEAFDRALPFCREEQAPLPFDAPIDVRKRILAKLGFEYRAISVKKGCKRPTVDGFAKDHPTGTYICNVANHEVAVVDGRYYDTWNSGRKCVYGYFEKV